MVSNNVGFSVTSVPEFVAGFVYGMTGDNHLDEIQTCISGGEILATEIESAITDIKQHDMQGYIQAGAQLAVALSQLGHSLDNCENMEDDISAIEEWAAVFENPLALAQRLALHYARHSSEVNTDIQNLETDWDSSSFFKAGEDVADIATLAVGPIEEDLMASSLTECHLTTSQIADLVTGFLYGFTGNNFQTEFQTCFQDTPEFEATMCEAYDDVNSGSTPIMVQGINIFLSQVPTMNGFLQGCPDATASVQQVGAWYRYWDAQSTKKLYFTIYQNIMANPVQIAAEKNAMSDAFYSGDVFGAGSAFATLATDLLPVQSSDEEAMPVELLQ